MLFENTPKVTISHFNTEKKFKLVDFEDSKTFDTEADDGQMSAISHFTAMQRRHMSRARQATVA